MTSNPTPDRPVNDMRELYAVQHAITDAGGTLTPGVHKAIDDLREVWDAGLRQAQAEAHQYGTALQGVARRDAAAPSVSAVDQTTRDRIAEAPADRAALLLWAADQIDAETRQAKAHGVLEPDKYRPCRDASAQLRALAGCQECASGLEHDTHCPTPESHNWGCGCPSDVAAAIASCPGFEMAGPSPCRCPCYGCKHHCAAHDPRRLADEVQQPAVGARQPDTETPKRASRWGVCDGCGAAAGPDCDCPPDTDTAAASAVPGRSAATSTDEEA